MIAPFDYLTPSERLGELLCGLIMALTFTLGAALVVGTEQGASASLLYATLGCNVAWGIIDSVLLLLDRMFDRGRLVRLGHAITSATDEHSALAVVAGELDETLVPITSNEQRLSLYRDVVAHVRATSGPRPRLTRDDFLAAIAVFLLEFLATLPAVLPYFLIHDAWAALRTSNALSICVLFYVGLHWAKYTSYHPLAAAFTVVGVGVGMVMIAILLGG